MTSAHIPSMTDTVLTVTRPADRPLVVDRRKATTAGAAIATVMHWMHAATQPG